MNDVVAIVVTYNRKELLKNCLIKLQKQTYILDIFVIDNASTDATSKLFEIRSKNVFYFNTGSNLGGAGGFNFGIKKAVELGYKYLWIIDDDTMPTDTALEFFIKKDKELFGKYGFLSSKVLWKDGTICNMNRQKKTKWKQIKNFDIEQSIQYASFVSLFIKAETIKKVGLPYKDFFIWADDWEYTRRISKVECSFLIPESVVYHWCDNNIGANIITTDINRINRFQYMYRNDVVMYRQDGFEGYLYLFIRNIIHILKILTRSNNKKAKIKMLLRATKAGIIFKPSIEYPKID